MNKRILLAVSALILIIIGISWWSKKDIITHADVKLTDVERKANQLRVDQISTSIKNFTGKTDKQTKFSYYQSLSSAQFILGNYKEARDALIKALAVDPKSPVVPQTNIQLSQILIAMHDYNGAKSAIERALDAKPNIADYWKAYIGLKIDHFNASDKDIRDLWQQAIKESNSDLYVMLYYGEYLEKIGDKAAALDQFRATVKLYPGNKEAQDAVARLSK